MSWRKKPRSGQQRAFDALLNHPSSLNVKLPTAYGKTFLCAGIYSILQKQGKVNRLLCVFPTDYQLEQFYNDAAREFSDTDVQGPLKIIDIRFSGNAALKEHRKNHCQIYAITIQSLKERRGFEIASELMQSGQWMVCIDEYHHYGIDKSWTKPVMLLPKVFLLAMSATPKRLYDDSAFGLPDISMSYLDAKEENSVKPLRGYAYNYRIDVLDEEGTEHTYTTAEFYKIIESDDPERIEKIMIARKMRWSPKYVSPLVSIPIERMLRDRIATGYRLQAIIGAMCVSHAEFVCEQIKALFPDIRVDWVGTGTNGRSGEENRAILRQFVPPKDESGRRPNSELDVLVHVGMAQEGLDTINVSEIVFLSGASVCNQKIQEIGRAARFLEGVTGHVSFDASSEFAKKRYVGSAIMDAMDFEPAKPKDGDTSGERDLEPLPEQPFIRIYEMELIEIDSGTPGVQRMAKVASQTVSGVTDYSELCKDLGHPGWQAIKDLYRAYQSREAEEFNEKSTVIQWRDSVENALNSIVARILRIKQDKNAGELKTSINRRKKWLLGKIENDLEVLRKHYQWLQSLDSEIINKGVPSWLWE